jgi:crossover junction endodeoxyribonuclease RusA
VTELVFHVPGTPRPQGSKRAVARGVLIEQSAHLPAWRHTIAAHARAAAARASWQPLTDPCGIVLRFAMPPGKGRSPRLAAGWPHGAFTGQSPDLDKLVRAVLDGITDAATVWTDDRLVCSIGAQRVWAGTDVDPVPGVTVRVAPALDWCP